MIYILMGVSGSGKSTVGQLLAHSQSGTVNAVGKLSETLLGQVEVFGKRLDLLTQKHGESGERQCQAR